MSGMIHNLLLELVVLPNVLALALHQVKLVWLDGPRGSFSVPDYSPSKSQG